MVTACRKLAVLCLCQNLAFFGIAVLFQFYQDSNNAGWTAEMQVKLFRKDLGKWRAAKQRGLLKTYPAQNAY